MSSEKKLTLKSSDGVRFEIQESVAMMSTTLKNMIDGDCASDIIPVHNINGKTLAMVIEYCKKHTDAKAAGADADYLKSYDSEFMVDVDQEVLYHLMMAANYLDVKKLLDACTEKVVDMVKGKTPEEIRGTFNIANDFTPEEEEEIRKENAWVFE